MESKFFKKPTEKQLGTIADIMGAIVPLIGMHAAKGKIWVIGFCVVVAVITVLSAYGRGVKDGREAAQKQ